MRWPDSDTVARPRHPQPCHPGGQVDGAERRGAVVLVVAAHPLAVLLLQLVALLGVQGRLEHVEPGARVVVQGAGFLNEGDKVTVSTGQPAAAPAAPAATAPARK